MQLNMHNMQNNIQNNTARSVLCIFAYCNMSIAKNMHNMQNNMQNNTARSILCIFCILQYVKYAKYAQLYAIICNYICTICK